MKFTQKQKEWDKQNNKYIFYPRVYSDFYCSLVEWEKLGRGKDSFMYQVREKIANDCPELCNEHCYRHNGCDCKRIPSLDRTGIRDSIDSAIYSGKIIKMVIKLITHKEAKVLFDCHKGAIKFVIISFPDYEMPNIIVIIDEYGASSTNYTLIKCIDAIYKTLQDKLTDWYSNYLHKFYNTNYDRYFYMSREDSIGDWTQFKGLWNWKDVFHKKDERIKNNIIIDYNTDEKLITV